MKKWYLSKICKAILIAGAYISAVVIAILATRLLAYQKVPLGTLLSFGKESYEDTVDFNNKIMNLANHAVNNLYIIESFETEGAYNPDKYIEITKYQESLIQNAVLKEASDGVCYKLGELVDWGRNYDGLYNGGRGEAIVTCQKPDGSFYYYKLAELRDLLYQGELKLSMKNMENQGEQDNQLHDPGQIIDDFYTEMRQNTYNGTGEIVNAEGQIVYTKCWYFDNFTEKYAPVGYESIIDIGNTNKQWNGRLAELVNNLDQALYFIYEDYQVYNSINGEFEEGNTNFIYLKIDPEKKQLYSNREKYNDFNQYEEYINELMRTGKYVKISPRLSEFKTNIEQARATYWDWASDGTIFVAAVDTSYPIEDELYQANKGFEQYNPWSFVFPVISFLVILIWLTVIAGRTTSDDEIRLHPVDGIKIELFAAALIGIWVLFIWRLIIAAFGYVGNQPETLTYIETGGAAFVSCTFFLLGYLSLVRRIKAKVVWKNSLLKWILKYVVRFLGFLKEVYANRSCTFKLIMIGGLILFFNFLLMLLNYDYTTTGLDFVLLIAEIVIFIFLLREAISCQKIRVGLRRISSGEVNYQIPETGIHGHLLEMVRMINRIGEGLEAAVEQSMKDERLKTDLITNVSHDIKTPLTSIINYVGLLKRENFTDKKILGYLDVLEAKAQRLKSLTEDVVEASKVSSGNVCLELMTLDLVEMIQQTGGEFQERFEQKELSVIFNLPDTPVLVRVDGRQMWRVLENIFNNAAKYTMGGTRIYADLKVKNKKAIFSLKNISALQLNISPNELTERFIRGDESRTTEGSGLGLSIAKSLVTLQGGELDILIDGDLFKVIITFPEAE